MNNPQKITSENSKTVSVNLANRSYDIVIGKHLSTQAANFLQMNFPKKTKVFIVTDTEIAKLHLQNFKSHLLAQGLDVHEIIISAGEDSKSFTTLEYILDQIFRHKPDRKSLLVAFGGGVVGDITGFAASILLRGVDFIQIPTTLLAMVDSSVGGKTAINSRFGKNLIGAFYQPKLVLADMEYLETLPKRQFLAGYAEIIKYGIIEDLEFFEFLENQQNFKNIPYMIEKSCAAKAAIVSRDEKESGDRALLNFGHTFGHAIEAIGEYDGRILHGEAVAIGMVMALKFSEFLGMCKIGEAKRLQNHLEKIGMKTEISQLPFTVTISDIVKFIQLDKKVSSGNLVFILASEIGKTFIVKDISVEKIKEFLLTEKVTQ